MDYYERKDEFIELLRSRLDEERFIHSLNVASAAEELAVLFDADRKKAVTRVGRMAELGAAMFATNLVSCSHDPKVYQWFRVLC